MYSNMNIFHAYIKTIKLFSIIITAYFNSVKSSELIAFNKVLVVLITGNVLSINSFISFFVLIICSFFKFNLSVLLFIIDFISSIIIWVSRICFKRSSHISFLCIIDKSCSSNVSFILSNSKVLSSIFSNPLWICWDFLKKI